jgi:adenylate cyclase
VANVRVNPDEDTIYRRLPLWQKFREMTIPTVPWALASIVRPGLDPARIPVDRQGRLIVRYFGPTGTYKTYPIASLINSYARMQEGRVPEVAPTDFAGKIVLVGLSAVGLYDIKASPLSGVVPGIEIQAAALDTLLNGLSFLLPSPTVGTGYLLALGLLAAVAVSLFRRTAVQVVGFVIFLLAPAAAGALAFASGWWLDYAAPTAAVLLALIGAAVLNYSLEGRERRFIKGVFRHYLSPPVIERILENPKLLRLGGEEREVTSFFSDIAGFTSLSESLSAHDLVALLNDYLTAMTDVILDAGGTLDKYEGDAIIAFWNAPLDDPDHALRACRAALACQQRLEALRPGFERRFGRGLRMRIGLNTGPAVVGNMGSARRFDYTAMGDTINLAARLEGAAKHYGVSILAGEATVGRAGDAIMSREVDVIRVVGKTRPARIFELIGEADAVPEETRMRLRAYGEALDLYRRRDWAGAASGFAVLPADPVAEVYAKRCRRFAVEEPAADWDFVLDLAAK